MKIIKSSSACFFGLVAITLICASFSTAAVDQVLAIVAGEAIHAHELDTAIASSPFYSQFNTMSEDEQASLRGDMLRRLVSARLLAMEAKRLGLDQTATFKRERDDFRLGLLYRSYMDRVRSSVTLPADTLASLQQKFAQDADALEAAKAASLSTLFRDKKLAALRQMQIDSHLKFFESRIRHGIKPSTVLMQSDGLRVVYGDLVAGEQLKKLPNLEWVKEQLQNRAELLLVARYAERNGENVDAPLARYVAERLPALMLEKKSSEWITSDVAMREWYAQHLEVGRIPASYHVGQIVLATREEAAALRARIVKGESLFTLSGEKSIDPAGRQQNGDMGWITEGRGMPELQQVLARLKDEELSQVVQTASGFHLLMVLERRIGRQKSFDEVRERVRQMMLNQQLPPYMAKLEQRYAVSWDLLAKPATAQSSVTP